MSTPTPNQPRAVNVDLQNDAMLQVDISDALSERDKVKFTVHTKVGLPLLQLLTLIRTRMITPIALLIYSFCDT